MPSLLKLPPGFGAAEDQHMNFSVTCMDDVVRASEEVHDFCLRHSYSPRTAYHIALCVEEMGGNVLRHGFIKKHKRYYSDIRVVVKGESLIARIRDNCREFDPRKRIDFYDPEQPEKNIGIRMVANTAREIDYYNNASVNTLLMKF